MIRASTTTTEWGELWCIVRLQSAPSTAQAGMGSGLADEIAVRIHTSHQSPG